MSDYKNDKYVEDLVDNILIRVADDIKSNRDKYLDIVMQDRFQGEGSEDNFRHDGSTAAEKNYNQNGGENAHRKRSTALTVVMIILAILLILCIAAIAGLIISIPKTSTIEDGPNGVIYIPEFDADEKESHNGMVNTVQDGADVRLEYVDFWIEDPGVDTGDLAYNIVIKNTGNRIICEPSIYLNLLNNAGDIVDERSPYSGAALLPGQSMVFKDYFDPKICTQFTIEYIGSGFYNGLWNYEGIPIYNSDRIISVEEGIERGQSVRAEYTGPEISNIDGPIYNGMNAENIGLEFVDLTVKHHATYDEIYVEVTNHTGFELQNICLNLCELDVNGNITDSRLAMNSYPDYESVRPEETVTIKSPTGDGSPAFYTVAIWQYDVKDDNSTAGADMNFSYLEIIPQAVSNME